MPAIEQLTFGLRKESPAGYAETIEQVRAALKEQGFGVLTEIDVKATLKAKIGEDVLPYIILGACNPPLAHRAITANPEVGMLLPCNVVVRETPGGGVVVEAMDPVAAMSIVQDEAVKAVAVEARDRLEKALAAL
ncbi:MAG: DUF302 domain-containing protein [Dehalococcoidia bacterium]|nr:DUF302 domain-containing protein [Dehalococcoidia bacterium]